MCFLDSYRTGVRRRTNGIVLCITSRVRIEYAYNVLLPCCSLAAEIERERERASAAGGIRCAPVNDDRRNNNNFTIIIIILTGKKKIIRAPT